MSVLAAELIAYSSGAWTANPDDSATVSSTTYANIGTAISTPTLGGVFGGAIDLTTRVILTQISATDNVEIVSSAADARTLTIVGRLSTGVLTSEVMTLNGVTQVTSANAYERIESVTLASASATLTVTVRKASDNVTICTIGGAAPSDATEIRAVAMFRNSTIPGSGSTLRYEKFFWKNANAAAFALTSAIITQASESPGAHMFHALASAVADAGAIANRITAPAAGILATGGAGTFDDLAKTVPGGANIAAGSQIGVWLQETLVNTDSPYKGTYTSQLDGNTT